MVVAEAEVASAAKEAAHLAGRMTMIDAQRLGRRLADAARVSLPLQDGPVVLQGQSVTTRTVLIPEILVSCPSVAPVRILEVLAGGPASAPDLRAQP